MKPITDPRLLEELNAAPTDTGYQATVTPSGGKIERIPVRDPALLQQLEQPTREQTLRASVPGRIIQGARDPLDAGAQMLTHSLPGGVVDTVNRATAAANAVPVLGPIMKALGMTPATTQELDQSIAKNERQYQDARSATGSTGADLARVGGNIAATLPLAVAAPNVAAASLPVRIGVGAASGAASGALQPVTENAENFAAEKGKQAAFGAITGGTTAPVVGALARIVRPNTRASVQTLMDEGVTPTAGQILGGTAQRLEDKARSIPIVGDAITAAQRRGVEDLNRAVYARAVEPIGGTAPRAVGREGVDQVYQQLRTAYDNLLPHLQFKADPQFAQELGRVHAMAGRLPSAQAQQFERILRDEVIGKLTPQGNASGETIKAVESELGRLSSGFRGDPSFNERQLGDALQEVQASIRRSLARTNPTHADELQRINTGYSIYARLRDGASRAGSKDGVMTPAQLAAAVRAGDRSVGKGNYARGVANMQDLSDAGRDVLASTYPDSGTAGRLMLGLGTGGLGYFFEPHSLTAAAAASLPYLPLAQRATAAALTQRPQAATAFADRIRQIIGPAAAVGAPALYQGASQ